MFSVLSQILGTAAEGTRKAGHTRPAVREWFAWVIALR